MVPRKDPIEDRQPTRVEETLGEFYTTASLAKRTDLTPYTIRRWCWQGRIPSYKVGGRRLIRKEDVEELLARCREEANPEFQLGR